MNPRSKHQTWKTGAVILLAGSLFALPAGLYAQETAAPEAPTPAQVAAEPEVPEDIVELSPFVVTGENDEGYRATSTLAGTRLRSEMRDIGSSISIVNKEFLTDTNSQTIAEVLLYTPNTEVAGLSGNYSAAHEAGAGNLISEINRDSQQGGRTRIRGLAGADLTRNYFITNIPFDTYNVDRVEVQRGANSALFGLGSPGGIVNHQTIAPSFQGNRNQVQVQLDHYGSFRGSFRSNVTLNEKLAVNVAALYSDRKFEQEEAFEKDKRVFAAFDWEIYEGIHFTGNAEWGDRNHSRVDYQPPNDGITPWIDQGKWIAENPADGGYLFRSSGMFSPTYANSQYVTLISSGSSVGMVSMYGDPNYPGPTFGGQVYSLEGRGLPAIDPGDGVRDDWMLIMPRPAYEIVRLTGRYPDGTALAPGESGFFARGGLSSQITDRSIFDYRKHNFSGGTTEQNSDWTSYQLNLTGVWFENRLGVDLSYMNEGFDANGRNPVQGTYPRTIFIDTNRYLMGSTDGSPDNLIPNPGFGLPSIGGLWGGNMLYSHLKSTRATVFGELRADDLMEEGTLESILGRLKVTGLFEKRESESGEMYSRDRVGYLQLANAVAGGDISAINAASYRTGSQYTLPSDLSSSQFLAINSLSDLAGANIGPIPFGVDRNRSPLEMNYQGWAWQPPTTEGGDPVQAEFVDFKANTYNLFDDGGMPASFYSGKSASNVDSQVLVGQWYIWDDTLVLMGSWRNDVYEQGSVGAPAASEYPGGTENNKDPAFLAGPQNLTEQADEDTTSWSVMLHTPQFIKDWLPWGSEVSLYASEASNFQPGANVDVYNNTIAPVTGDTSEMGIIISTANGKLVGRFNWYETAIANRRFDVGGISSSEGVLRALVEQTKNPDNIDNGWTVADSQAYLPPQGVQDVNGFQPNWADGTVVMSRDSRDSGTQDFVSEGFEFEITYNPVSNWTMMLSIGKQETVTSNSYPVFGQYVDDFVIPNWVNSEFAQSYFMNTDSSQTLAQYAQTNLVDNANRGRLQDGFPQIEQRKYRVNFNTSYTFAEDSFIPDFLGRFSVGGGYRWQDKAGIGFGVSQNELGDYTQDVDKPIYGAMIGNIDLFFRSQYQIRENDNLIIQLNIKDVLNNTDLQAVYANPDGSRVYRFMEGMLINLTATYEF